MKTFPICLTGLDGRRSLVIGGGKVADRKVRALLEAGAKVTVISPSLVPELDHLSQEDRIQVLRRAYRPGDLEGVFLVIAATDDPALNHAVWEEAQRCGCLINVVDDPRHSNFILPAVLRRGEFTLSISTGGGSPALARRIREQLEPQFGPEYGELARLLAELRPDLLRCFASPEARLSAALALIDAGALLSTLREEGYEAARRLALETWSAIDSGPEPSSKEGR